MPIKQININITYGNHVDAKIGNVAFLDPEILIVPESFLSPMISNLCNNLQDLLFHLTLQ